MKARSIGLAFGGGAARGFAHIGVVKTLEEEEIDIDYVAGTSVGSLIGALYCAGFSWDKIQALTIDIGWTDLVSFKLGRMGLFVPDKMEQTLDNILGGKTFSELEKPFKVTAVNVENAQQVVLEKGNVAQAVLASCSVPGFFFPKKIDNMLLIDGGMRNSVPGDVVKKMGADIVIGVNLNADKTRPNSPRNAVQVVRNTMRMLVANNIYMGLPFIDLLVEPDVHEFGYGNLRNKKELCERGEKAMAAAVAKLRSLMKEEQIRAEEQRAGE